MTGMCARSPVLLRRANIGRSPRAPGTFAVVCVRIHRFYTIMRQPNLVDFGMLRRGLRQDALRASLRFL